MSEYLAAAAAAIGGPEDLVARSAAARAQAQGISADDILQAWAGGGSAPAPASAPETTADTPPQPAPELVASDAVEEPVVAAATEAPATDVMAAPAATATAVMVADEPDERIEPAELRDRIRFPGKLGAALGFMLGMVALVASTPFLFDKVTLGGTEEDPTLLWSVQPARMLLYITIVSALFGALISRMSGVVPAWFDKSLGVQSTGRSLVIVGGGIGAMLGVLAAGILLASGTPVEVLPEEPAMTQLAIVPVMLLVLGGGAVLGSVTAVVAQIMAIPAGLSAEERAASQEIKHRLGTSYIMPTMVVLAIVLLVVPFGVLLVEFHSAAPLIAIVTSAGILGFAFLSASRPGMRISASEAMVAAAGIGTVVLFIVLVANAVSHS